MSAFRSNSDSKNPSSFGSQIRKLFDGSGSSLEKASSSYSFKTHQITYIYPSSSSVVENNKSKSFVPNISINKNYNSTSASNNLQFTKEQVFTNPQILDVLDDIFNVKLQCKYNDSTLEYVKNEQKHTLGPKDEDVEIKLFDDDVDVEIEKPNNEKINIKLFEDDSDEDVPFMDQLKKKKTIEEKEKNDNPQKRKRKEKSFSFLEDSDDEQDNHDISIAVNEEESDDDMDVNDEEDDRAMEFMKSKAAETHQYISSTKLKKNEKPNARAKKRKATNDWKKIQTIMKEKDDQKQKESNSSDL